MSAATDGLTPDVLESIVVAALKDGDVEAVDAALRLLAVRAPRRAEMIFQTLRVGLALNGVST